MLNSEIRLGILYEHPEWFRPLFDELDRRGIQYDRLLASEHSYDPKVRTSPYSLIFNRMSPSAYLRGHGNGIFYVRQYLAYLQDIGVKVVNPYKTYLIETSKALQLEIYESLGLSYPRTRVINHASQAVKAAEGLEFPIIVKPNIGGSGAKIQRFENLGEFQATVEQGSLNLGIDHTALVQEFLPAQGGYIVRIEVMDDKFLYAIQIFTNLSEGFNLCPADICLEETSPKGANGPATEIDSSLSYCLGSDTSKRALHIESFTPPHSVIQEVLRIAKASHLDVGGIEYLVNDRDGQHYYYDNNALSNFVTDAPEIVGFDPFPRLVDFLMERASHKV